ncbi:ATP-grasp domain-containing protein [Candidatus Aerophobetes bacterium]|nr:ATP-grasp domain-containing protein [Candidatus Aerophobetes bacterium]
MKKYKVLIVPAGSGMAVAAIKSLKKDKKIKIISADRDRLAPGLYLSHQGYLVPPFSDDLFFPTLKEICRKEKINVILPALDTILYDFSIKKEEFEKIGVRVLVSSPETISITRDKWKTYLKLREVVSLPLSFLKKEDIDIGFPLIIKPRDGSGSRDVYKVSNKEELDFFYRRVSNPIIQEYLEGREYTVDCFADRKGSLLFHISRERMETRAGISVKGKIVKSEALECIALKVSESIKFCGPFFFQAKEDKNGVPKLTEVNPRISGTMSFSSSTGPNFHSLAVRMLAGEKINVSFKQEKDEELYVTRYFEDIYVRGEDIKNFLRGISS